MPRLIQGDRLLISTHGNTLRALIMALGKMSAEEIASFEIPTATPLIYRFDMEGRPLGWHYLKAPETCLGCAA